MATSYIPPAPTPTLTPSAPIRPTPTPFPSKTHVQHLGALTATTTLFADKLMFTLTTGLLPATSWFHAPLPPPSLNPAAQMPPISHLPPPTPSLANLTLTDDDDDEDDEFQDTAQSEWNPSLQVDVRTLLGVGKEEDNGRFVAGMLIREVERVRGEVDGVVVGVGRVVLEGAEIKRLVREGVRGVCGNGEKKDEEEEGGWLLNEQD
ncbi:hypothetical protein BJ508DRAFT_417237 [Ascobolus immersus RN42]|uniref:Uncharacterized protein n=1 Tax=Ascobolus immersus RN42 TaxID=1160509 RepID=A0A3N4HTH1_ASCIM|nr:hypothetical protein BJ508DRAFT_417237 [Ascobolus immersus RN42]